MRVFLFFLVTLCCHPFIRAAGVDYNSDARLDFLWIVPRHPAAPVSPDAVARHLTGMLEENQPLPVNLTVLTNACPTLAGAAWYPGGEPLRETLRKTTWDWVIISENAAFIENYPALAYAAFSALRRQLPPRTRAPLFHTETAAAHPLLARMAAGISADALPEAAVLREMRKLPCVERQPEPLRTDLDEYAVAGAFYSAIMRGRLPPLYDTPRLNLQEQRLIATTIQKQQRTLGKAPGAFDWFPPVFSARSALPPFRGIPARTAFPAAAESTPAAASLIFIPPGFPDSPPAEEALLKEIDRAAGERLHYLPLWPVFFESIRDTPAWKDASTDRREQALKNLQTAMAYFLSTRNALLPEDAFDCAIARAGVDFLLRTGALSDDANILTVDHPSRTFRLWRDPKNYATLRLSSGFSGSVDFSPKEVVYTSANFDSPIPFTCTAPAGTPVEILWSLHASKPIPGINKGAFPLEPESPAPEEP